MWRSKDFNDSAAYSSPLLVEIGGKKQYVQLTDASVCGINPEDGYLLWPGPRPGRTAVITTPIVHDNYVFVTSAYHVGCDLFKITQAGGKFQAEHVYHNNEMENHHGGVILVGDYLYGTSEQA